MPNKSKVKLAVAEAEAQAQEPTVTSIQQKKLDSLNTWASKFRYLDSEGYPRAQIAQITNKRYQQVRNTLITPVNRQRSKIA